MDLPQNEPVTPSPCNGVCTIDRASNWCVGCGRNLDEISQWPTADEAKRRDIVARLPARMAVLGG
ncbi:DUF1289 domain-containing protein [Aquisediminimonas sediminicola]|uniref:DUF1289 domain-containing protein n=1 Tax=Alteraquisediminimonas sediminicola TaxID=2676787 RepID=UPI001C8D90E8|nr:DUF1289 domain-containing protein [Aquisediminimonas sediminicola]